MPPIQGKPSTAPQMVNRGGPGLLRKIPEGVEVPSITQWQPSGKLNKIAPALKDMAVDLASLTPDPLNAREHGERNLQAIMQSLDLYGQVKPIVVRKKGKTVMAGNGTLAAAKALGWTKIAASVVEMDEFQAVGYGLADNRTAELATWKLKVLEQHAKFLEENAKVAVGFTAEEVFAMRLEDFVEPPAQFPEVDEDIEIEHQCPKCGYLFSGGGVVEKGKGGDAEDDVQGDVEE